MNKSSKKITAVTLGTTVVSCIITLIIGFCVGSNWDSVFKNFKPYLGFKTISEEKINLDSVQNLYSVLKENYDGDLDKTALVEGAKKGLVAAAGDQYTEYMTTAESTEYKKALEAPSKTLASVSVYHSEKITLASFAPYQTTPLDELAS